MTKITKRDMFTNIINVFQTGESAYDPADVIAFCEKEIAALDSKAVKAKERAAAKKAEADVLLDQVKAVLTADFQPIADIAAAVAEVNPDATVAKVTNRLTKLVAAEVAEKTDLTIPGVDGAKSRKVKGFRMIG
jgi:hypothetical protein